MIAALLILAQITPVPDDPKPVATSIAAIRTNPKKFDGEIVRLHGYVNDCKILSCRIYERTTNAQGGPGGSLSIAKDNKFDEVVRPIVPTYVEFDARFSAECLTTAVCTDRAPELTVVTLRGIVSPEPPPFENN
jgi:hypothetical protein